ncbi:MAG: GntR family transcriptional regulator [Pirellulales bacterium]|nr:GntR family transcriptional regulator [Pirellulales bacterium]
MKPLTKSTKKPRPPGEPRPVGPQQLAHGAGSSRVDEVYARILAQIIRGELPGGAELKSTQLAASLGVSRTPVVQALARLIADGIVTQRMNMRAVVRPGAENWLIEVHELRLLLEPAAAARAAGRITADALAQLAQQAAEVAPHADGQWLARARQFDFAIHLSIADHAGNQPMRDAIYKCWQYKQLSYELSPDRVDSVVRGFEEHLTILEALKAGDPATASAAMELHLRLAKSYRPEGRVI